MWGKLQLAAGFSPPAGVAPFLSGLRCPVGQAWWLPSARRIWPPHASTLTAAILFLAALLPALAQSPDNIAKLIADSNLTEAQAAAHSLLADLEKQNKAESAAYANALDLLIEATVLAGSPTPAIVELADRTRALKARLGGPENPGIANTTTLLGLQYHRTGEYKTAIATLEPALAIEDASPDVPVHQLTRTLNVLGQSLASSDQGARAVALHQRSLALCEKAFGPQSREAAEVLSMLGDDAWRMGDLKTAQDYQTRALTVFETAVGPNHMATGIALGMLATIYKDRGEFATAIDLHRRAIVIYEKNLGPDHPRLVSQYNNLGLALKESGDPPGARTALEHALSISQSKLGPENTATATVLGNLGITLQEGGDFTGARDAYERALAIQEKRLGPDHQLVATLLNSLGLVLSDIGDYKEARKRIERSLAIYEKTVGPEYPKTIEVLDNLGELLAKSGDKAGARAAFERAWQTCQKTFGENNPHTAWALSNLAHLDLEMGDLSDAQPRFEGALRAQEATLGPDHPRVADTLSGLAAVAAKKGDYAEALRLHARAAEIWTSAYGPAYPPLAAALAGEADALAHQGRPEDALRVAIESASVRRESVLLTTRSIGEREALLYAGKDREGLNVALRLAPRASPESRRDVWDALMQERALVLDEMGQRHHAIRELANPEVSTLAEQVAAARDVLAKTVMRGPGDSAPAYTARVQTLRDQLEFAERTLAETSAGFRRDLQARRAGFADALAALPARSALIGYVRSEGSYLAFAIRSGEKTPSAVLLGRADRIDGQIAAWRKQIDRERDSLGRDAKQNEANYRLAGAALRRSLWDPLAPYLAGAQQVYIVPDGALQLINLAALPTGPSGYLVESGPVLHLLSAERDLAAPPVPSRTGELLAVGNPAFSATHSPAPALVSNRSLFRGDRSGCPDFAQLDFPDLPGSALEAQAIVRIWRAQGMEATSLIGAHATESALKELVEGKRVIHLATHGFFLPESCGGAAALMENPLLRSGLALAGANRRASAGPNEDDGILTAEEVASLNLEGVDWVVLSGCDTGLGEIQAGEGVLGLRRAFRIAGAQTLITSLWAVGDDDARDWMTSLYRARFVDNQSTAAAVRRTSLGQLRARRAAGKSTHPFYWAGFIAVGGA